MYSLATLATEIRGAVSNLETHNQSAIISKRWVTTAVLAHHDAETATPFSACCGRYTVEQAVDRYFRELRSSASATARSSRSPFISCRMTSFARSRTS